MHMCSATKHIKISGTLLIERHKTLYYWKTRESTIRSKPTGDRRFQRLTAKLYNYRADWVRLSIMSFLLYNEKHNQRAEHLHRETSGKSVTKRSLLDIVKKI